MKVNYSRFIITFIVLLLAACLFFMINDYYTRQRDMKSGICSFYSAVYMVTNQVKHKKITIFATEKPNTEHKPLGVSQNINIEVVFSPDILGNNQPLSGSYNQFNNSLLLEYASYEYLNKDKETGKVIIDLISIWAPRTSVATSGKSISAEKLKRMIESKNPKVKEILASRAEQWTLRQKDIESWVVSRISSTDQKIRK